MITPLQCKILRIISDNPGLSGKEIAGICGYKPQSASSRYLPLLGSFGLVRNRCPPLSVKSKGQWHITEKGTEVLRLVDEIEKVMS